MNITYKASIRAETEIILYHLSPEDYSCYFKENLVFSFTQGVRYSSLCYILKFNTIEDKILFKLKYNL